MRSQDTRMGHPWFARRYTPREGWATRPTHGAPRRSSTPTFTPKVSSSYSLTFWRRRGFMPILIRAYRIPLAEVIAPLMQSAFGSISCNFGTAALAAGPRFPSAVATQYRTESSGESSRDVISVTSASVTSLLLTFCVRLARRSAASVIASTVFPELTFAMLSLICFISAGPSLASAI